MSNKLLMNQLCPLGIIQIIKTNILAYVCVFAVSLVTAARWQLISESMFICIYKRKNVLYTVENMRDLRLAGCRAYTAKQLVLAILLLLLLLYAMVFWQIMQILLTYYNQLKIWTKYSGFSKNNNRKEKA